MQITKEINGHEYTFEVTQNWLAAHDIAKCYDGYKIFHCTSCYCSKLYLQNTSVFEENKEPKLIGTLIYNPDTERMILYKKVSDEEHKFIKGQSYGINNEIIKHLRTFDKIIIDNSSNRFEISVAKAIKVGEYLHFNKYELQLFIPIEEFKMTDIKKNKKGKKNVYKK